jgi:hypothetical protein
MLSKIGNNSNSSSSVIQSAYKLQVDYRYQHEWRQYLDATMGPLLFFDYKGGIAKENH